VNDDGFYERTEGGWQILDEICAADARRTRGAA
jgi:hypothetical protein